MTKAEEIERAAREVVHEAGKLTHSTFEWGGGALTDAIDRLEETLKREPRNEAPASDGPVAAMNRDEEYTHTLALLKDALPGMYRALRARNPRGPAPLTAGQFQELARALWDHGYAYGTATKLESEARVLRAVAALLGALDEPGSSATTETKPLTMARAEVEAALRGLDG